MSREDPVTEFVIDDFFACAKLNELLGDGGFRFGDHHAVSELTIHMRGIIDHGLFGDVSFKDLDDWEVVFLCESVVSRVMGRNGHNGTGSIGTKDVIGDIDRDGFAVYWVDGGRA